MKTHKVILEECDALILELDKKNALLGNWYEEQASRNREKCRLDADISDMKNTLSHLQQEYAEAVVKGK